MGKGTHLQLQGEETDHSPQRQARKIGVIAISLSPILNVEGRMQAAIGPQGFSNVREDSFLGQQSTQGLDG